jgi:hypothetical protein
MKKFTQDELDYYLQQEEKTNTRIFNNYCWAFLDIILALSFIIALGLK